MKRCPICGKPVESLDICPECYAERRNVFEIDDIIELTRCPRCGFFKISGRWRDVSFEDALLEVVISKIRVIPEFDVERISVTPLTRGEVGKYSITLNGRMDDVELDVEKVVDVRVLSEVCWKCSREAGGYYEAIVQIRADNRKVSDEEIETVMEIIERILNKERENKKAFVSKIVERKEGIDFYFGDRNIGRKVSRTVIEELGGRIIESKKIHTRKDGRDVYRFTYAVRLPEYRKGDVVEEDGKICVVTSQRLGKAVSIDGESIRLRNPKLIARREEIVETVVVGCDDFVVEILHPRTHEVVQVRRPKVNIKPGDTIFVVERDDSIYVIPKELV